jgi:hypothetical protein
MCGQARASQSDLPVRLLGPELHDRLGEFALLLADRSRGAGGRGFVRYFGVALVSGPALRRTHQPSILNQRGGPVSCQAATP